MRTIRLTNFNFFILFYLLLLRSSLVAIKPEFSELQLLLTFFSCLSGADELEEDFIGGERAHDSFTFSRRTDQQSSRHRVAIGDFPRAMETQDGFFFVVFSQKIIFISSHESFLSFSFILFDKREILFFFFLVSYSTHGRMMTLYELNASPRRLRIT